MLQLKIIKDLTTLEPFWEPMNTLVSKCAPNIFLTSEWLKSCCETFCTNHELLFILGLHKDGSLKGFAPLKIATLEMLGLFKYRQLDFVGTDSAVSSEYLQFVSEPESTTEFERLVCDYLQEHRSLYDIMSFSYLDQNNRFARDLTSLMNGQLLRTEIFFDFCPYFMLPPSFEEFLAKKSYNMRKITRRIQKRLEREFRVEIKYITETEDIDEALAVAKILHEKARLLKNENGTLSDPKFLDFHKRIAKSLLEKGNLILVFLNLDGQPMAFRYGFYYNRKYYDYQTGYDPEYEKWRPGHALVNYLISELIKMEGKEFDFLQGCHDYKYHWADQERTSVIKKFYRRNLKGVTIFIYDSIAPWFYKSLGWVSAVTKIQLVQPFPTLRQRKVRYASR